MQREIHPTYADCVKQFLKRAYADSLHCSPFMVIGLTETRNKNSLPSMKTGGVFAFICSMLQWNFFQPTCTAALSFESEKKAYLCIILQWYL